MSEWATEMRSNGNWTIVKIHFAMHRLALKIIRYKRNGRKKQRYF